MKGASGWAARKGCLDVEHPKRKKRTRESGESDPRRRRADLRVPDGRFRRDRTPGSGVEFHARISSSTAIPRKSPGTIRGSWEDDGPRRSRPGRGWQIKRHLFAGKRATCRPFPFILFSRVLVRIFLHFPYYKRDWVIGSSATSPGR